MDITNLATTLFDVFKSELPSIEDNYPESVSWTHEIITDYTKLHKIEDVYTSDKDIIALLFIKVKNSVIVIHNSDYSNSHDAFVFQEERFEIECPSSDYESFIFTELGLMRGHCVYVDYRDIDFAFRLDIRGEEDVFDYVDISCVLVENFDQSILDLFKGEGKIFPLDVTGSVKDNWLDSIDHTKPAIPNPSGNMFMF